MKKYFIIITTILSVSNSFAQNDIETGLKNDVVQKINQKKTANTKDILTSLYRAGLDNILGKEHKFSFSSSFYGIDSLLRNTDPSKAFYTTERFLRSNSFDISVKGDSVNNITELGGGFTFTLINKKDVEYKKIKELTRLVRLANLFEEVRKKVNLNIAANAALMAVNPNLPTQIQASWTAADKTHDYTTLMPEIKQELTNLRNDIAQKNTLIANFLNGKGYIITDAELVNFIDGYLVNGKDVFHEEYVEITERYARKPLLTLSPAMSYDKVHKQGSYGAASSFTVSFGKDLTKKPWELEAKALIKIENDTSIKKTNYDNKPLSVSVGINKVLIENETKESKMEFKFFTQYDYQFGNVPIGKKAGLFTLNSTFRVNVYKSLWLPVTLKYDPDNHNFLGIFSITANLGN